MDGVLKPGAMVVQIYNPDTMKWETVTLEGEKWPQDEEEAEEV